MTKMFPFVTETWNPLGGECPHKCIYCWARRLIEKNKMAKYQGEPRIVEKELNRKFKDGIFVFVQDMSDLLADGVPFSCIERVLAVIREYPKTSFLVLTKNPKRYLELLEVDRQRNYTLLSPKDEYYSNLVLGATIETDQTKFDTPSQIKDYSQISQSPPPYERLYWFTHVLKVVRERKKENRPKLFINIEPILDFSSTFHVPLLWFNETLFGIAVGYDNYENLLPEPLLQKTEKLISELETSTLVYRKTIKKAWYE